MKRTEIPRIPFPLPKQIEGAIDGGKIYDSSSSPEARVYYIDKSGGMFLKSAPSGALRAEAQMTEYMHSMGLAPEVIEYLSGDRDIMLSRRLRGEDCTHPDYLADPYRLAELTGAKLRMLHSIDPSLCPRRDRMAEYIRTVDENYKKGLFDPSYTEGESLFRNAEEAYAVFSDGRSLLRSDTLIHGDYCLPNVILDEWGLSGFIDLGNGGVGDRHVDIYWGAWTLKFNTGTDVYRDTFLNAYGRDRIDGDALRVIAAAECFG